LHRFDLSDPAIPITIPGVRWLPLYYCFDFRANSLGYQLLSDESLVTFFPTDDQNVSEEESWPGENYPLEFPQSSISTASQKYDPTNPKDAFAWAGIFGIAKLSTANQAAVKARTAAEMEGLGFFPPETEEEFEQALSRPFLQGRPNGTCLNPQCENTKAAGKLSTIALVPAEPVPGVHTFGEHGTGVQLIVQICRVCHTLRVSNEC
jgi:hypothetical protein